MIEILFIYSIIFGHIIRKNEHKEWPDQGLPGRHSRNVVWIFYPIGLGQSNLTNRQYLLRLTKSLSILIITQYTWVSYFGLYIVEYYFISVRVLQWLIRLYMWQYTKGVGEKMVPDVFSPLGPAHYQWWKSLVKWKLEIRPNSSLVKTNQALYTRARL